MTLIIAPRSRVSILCAAHAPSHVLSLLSPGGDAPIEIASDKQCFNLTVNDITTPVSGLVVPDQTAIRRLLDFGAGWSGETPFLVYCWAGISRSPAAAFALACQHFPDIAEDAIALALRKSAPWVTPNPLIVRIADDLLGRAGRMVRAVARIGRGVDAPEGAPIFLSRNNIASG